MKRWWLGLGLGLLASPLLAASADLAISKSDGRDSVGQGETLTYTVVVTNLGPDGALGAAVADTLPADLLAVTWTCSPSPGADCPASGSGDLAVSVDLPAASSVTFRLTGTVATDAQGTLTNSATVLSPGGVGDPDGSNNSASDSTALTPLVDLFVDLDDGGDSAVPGGQVSYRLVAGNAGPQAATDVQLSAGFAPGLSCAWSCTPSGGASCDAASGVGDLQQTVQLPATARLTYTVDCQIPSQALAPLESTAQISTGATSTELELADNTSRHDTTLTPLADVAIQVSDGRSTAVPGGDNLTYTVTVRNNGPSDAASVVVENDFPQVLGDLPWTCLAAGSASCTATGSGDLLDTVVLPAGTSVSYFATAGLPSHLQGDLSNSARVTPPNNVGDPDEGNNQASDLTHLTPRVDLRIAKTDHTAQAAPGGSTSYFVEVQNVGPSDAPQSLISDPLPAALSCDWSCLASPGASCQNSGSGSLTQLADLPRGTAVTYELSCHIDPAASGTLSNTAQVAPAQGIEELHGGDNSATDLTALETTADLRITVDDQRLEAVPGDSLSYVIEVFNAGPSAVTEAQVNDTFPPELTCRWSCVGSDGGHCTPGQVSGHLSDNAVLPVAAKVTYSAQCDIASDAQGTLINSASVTSTATDPFPGDNSASDADTILTPQVDLQVSNTDDRLIASPGESLTYRLSVTNAGPSDALQAQISDVFPHQVAAVTWTCLASGEAQCRASGDGPLAELVSLPAGTSVTFTAIAQLRSDASGSLSNTLQATAAAGTTEIDSTDNLATDTTSLEAVADLGIELSDDVTTAVAGASLTYRLRVHNAGPADAVGTWVTTALSPQLDELQWTCVAEGGATCDADGFGELAQRVDLPVDGSLTFALTGDLSSQASGTLSSNASVLPADGVTDPHLADNTAADIDTVVGAEADLGLSLDNGSQSTVPGSTTLYQLTVHNLGPSDAPASRLRVPLPPLLECSWQCQAGGGADCGGTPASGDLDLSLDLPAASQLLYSAECAVDPAAQGELGLSAQLTPAAAVTDPSPANDQAADLDTLTPTAEIVISKSDGVHLATPGGELIYTIRVRNLGGPSDAPGVTVSDPFPAVLSCLWSCQGQGGAQCSQGQTAGNLLDVAHLPVDGEAVYTATCEIDDAAVGSVINSATATVPPGLIDSNGSNNSALDSTALEPLVDLAVELSDGVTTAIPGSTVSYGLRVRHLAGPGIEGAVVQDIFPPQLDCLWTCQGLNGGLCTPGQVQGDIVDTVSLPVAAEVLYSAVCDIAPEARGYLTQTATVELPPGAHDPQPANNQSADLDTLLEPRVEVAVALDDGVTSVAPGGQLVYALTVSNGGPSSVEEVRVEDLFGDLLDCSWTCSTFDGATCTAGPVDGDLVDWVELPANSHLLYEATCRVQASAGATLSNSATVQLPLEVEDTHPLNNQASDDDTRVELITDLSLSLSNQQSLSVPGTAVVYELLVQRSADDFAFEPINAPPHGPTTYRLWRRQRAAETPGADDGLIRLVGEVTGTECHSLAWRQWDLLAAGEAILGAQCRPDSGSADGWRPLRPPSAGLDATTAGGHGDFANLLPAAVELTVQSVPGPELSCTWSCLASPGSACDPGPVAGPLSQAASLAAGGRLDYRASCDLASGVTGTLTLTAQLVTPPGVIDPTPEDHHDHDVDVLEPRADLHLSKSDGTNTATPGGSLVYTLTAGNSGPSDSPEAVISDFISQELSCLWSCQADPGAACAAGQTAGDLLDSPHLPAGGRVTYTAQCDIAPDAQGIDGHGMLANTAQIEVPPSVVELNSSDNVASDLDTVLVPQGNLGIRLHDDTTVAVAGESLTYTLRIHNHGPSQLDGVAVLGQLDSALTCLWSCQAQDGASCAGGQSAAPLADTVFLPADSSALYTIDCRIAPEARGTLLSSATVSPPPGAVDPDPADNHSQDDDTALEARADLSIGKDDGVTEVAPGGSLTYTLTVHNHGPSSDAAAVVQDLFPADLDCQWTCQPSPGNACTPGPVLGELIDTAQLTAGGGVIYTAQCQLAGDADGQLLNHATVQAGQGVSDPDLNNNSAADLDQVIPLADLTLSKTDGVVEAVPGTSLTYTLVAGNAGPSDVLQAELRDQVSGLLSCQWSCSSSGNAGCGGGPTTGDLAVLIDLPVGGVVTWQGDCDIAADATGSLSNTAVLTPPTGVLDLQPANNTASDTDTLLLPTADLSVSKDDGVDEALAGETLVYTMVATNDGPSDAPEVIVSDPFPTVLSCTWSCQPSAGASCSDGLNDGDLLDSATLPAGSHATYTASCVIAEQAVGEISNRVSVEGGSVIDPDPSNNSATDVDSLIDSADLTVQLVDAPDPVAPGGHLLYALQVTNLGPAADGEVALQLTLPPLVEMQSLVVGGPEVLFSDGFEAGTTIAWGAGGGIPGLCQRAGSQLTCNLGTLAAEEQRELTLTVVVDPSADGALILSTTVAGAGSDDVSGNNSATEVTTVGGD